jgi:hypothetical protein
MSIISAYRLTLKLAVSFLAFALTFALVLTIGNQALAHEGERHDQKAPLFVQPEADLSKSTPPSAPELLEPEFMAKINGATTTLKWKSVAMADYYTVQLATDPNFKWLVANEFMHKSTSLEAKGLEAGKHYYWRVFAGKSSNEPSYTKSIAAKSMFQVQ